MSYNLSAFVEYFDSEDGGPGDMKPNRKTTSMLCAQNALQVSENEN